MNKYIAMIVGVMVLVSNAFATPSLTVSTGVADKYVSAARGQNIYDKGVGIADLFLAFENGAYIDFWGSKALNDGTWGSNFGDEVDYGGGYVKKFGNGFTLNISANYFDLLAGTFGVNDVICVRTKVSRNVVLNGLGEVTVVAQYDNFNTMPNTSHEGGSVWCLSVNKSQTHQNKLSINASEALIYDDGAFALDSGLLAKFGLGFSWTVSPDVTLVAPQLNLYVPLTVHDSRETEIVGYVGAIYKWHR